MAPPLGTLSSELDLFATNGQTTIQLTQSVRSVSADGTHTGVAFGIEADKPSWSNDGKDSFCSVKALHYQGNEVQDSFIYRLEISGTDLDLIAANQGSFTPLSPGDPGITPIIMTSNFPTGYALREHHWSPDGRAITFTNGDSSPDLFVSSVDINGFVDVDVANAALMVVQSNSGVSGPQWSPIDGRIAYSSGARICTVLPGNPSVVLDLASGYSGSRPMWSMDGTYLAYERRTTKGFSYTYNVWRIPASGGTSVNLTSDLDPALKKTLLGWIP